MLKMFKHKKGQNTAEYAILIALVVGGVIAMQTYAQRTLQARLRDASVMFRDQTNGIGNTLQYEPYYTNTSTVMDRNSVALDTFNSQQKNNVAIKKQASTDKTNYVSGAVVPTSRPAETGM